MKHAWTLVALLLGGTIAMSAAHAQPKTEGGADAIRPFTVHVPDEALADLKRRIAATRGPARETVSPQVRHRQRTGSTAPPTNAGLGAEER